MSDAPPPDLADPTALAVYRAELRRVAVVPRTLGMMLAVMGLVVALMRAFWWPMIPRLVPIILIVAALGLMGLGIVRRTRYHLERIRKL